MSISSVSPTGYFVKLAGSYLYKGGRLVQGNKYFFMASYVLDTLFVVTDK